MNIELGYRDTSSYFSVYFNRPTYWNLRLYLRGRTKVIEFDITEEQAPEVIPENFEILPPTPSTRVRVRLDSINDLHALNRAIFASFEKTISDREKLKDGVN